jgi:hypothetical protein
MMNPLMACESRAAFAGRSTAAGDTFESCFIVFAANAPKDKTKETKSNRSMSGLKP